MSSKIFSKALNSKLVKNLGGDMLSGVMQKGQNMTKWQRALNRQSITGMIARFTVSTMLWILIMFLIYGFVDLATNDKGTLFQGKLVISSLAVMLGLLFSYIVPRIVTLVYKPLDFMIE